jgi:SAM-dependent methyltransferase
VAPAEAVGSLDGPFDAIAAFHVVEHLADPARVLAECSRATRTGGLLIYATPNPKAPFAERKGDRWYGRRDPTHISLKEPEEWLRLTRDAGYRIGMSRISPWSLRSCSSRSSARRWRSKRSPPSRSFLCGLVKL